MKYKAEIRIESEDSENILSALEKEAQSLARFKTLVFKEDNDIVISIEAKDAVALRSAINTFLRYLQVIEGFNKNIEGDE